MAAVNPRGGPPRSPEPLSNASFGDLVAMVTEQVTNLVKTEIDLARTELRDEATKAAKAGAMAGAAGMAGALGVGFASLAVARFLALFLPKGLAYAILAAAYGAGAAALLQRAREQMQEVRPVPEQAVQSLK